MPVGPQIRSKYLKIMYPAISAPVATATVRISGAELSECIVILLTEDGGGDGNVVKICGDEVDGRASFFLFVNSIGALVNGHDSGLSALSKVDAANFKT